MSAEGVLHTPTPSHYDIYPSDSYEPDGYILPSTYRDYYKQVLELPIYDDDVWIETHPKSGTTWTSEMVWLLRHNLDYDGAKQPLDERVPYFEQSSMILNRMSEEKREIHKKTQPLVFADSVRNAAEMPRPRTFKTHLHWNIMPKELQRPDCKAKIIHVSRDPKDVCWSYYHHYKLLHKYSGSFEEYAEIFLADKLIYSPFWKHFLEFWDHRDQKNILFLRYEDMKKDLPSVIRVVNEFLGMPPLNEEQLVKITRHLSFNSMKSNKAVNTNFGARPKPGDSEVNQFLRKGIVGDGKENMSPDMARRFDEWTAEQTRGYELPF